MPQSYKAQIGVQMDSNLPEDWMYVTPHFSDTVHDPVDVPGLASALSTALTGYLSATSVYSVVKIYRDVKTTPNYPLATVYGGVPTTVAASAVPRELALCLSYYGGFNRPRFRGRLYLPAQWLIWAGGSASLGKRPTATQQGKVQNFVLQVLAHASVSAKATWTLRSERDDNHADVTNYYVDDEWDIQRRRGTKPTSRIAGTP